MTHRTSYPALSDHLNYYSAACNGNMERYRQKMKLSGAWENLQRSSAALRRLTGLVHELSNSVVSAQLVETNDRNLLTTVIVPMTALAIRLVLRLETDISFVASIQLKEVYAAPPSLDMLPHEPSQVPTEDDDWHTVARRCGAVRAECSRFTMEVFSALTATELNEGITTNGKTRPKRKPSQLLLEMVSGSFYSLLRRHYLVTKHQMAHHYSSLADTKVLYDSFLSIFLLLRERHNSTLPISDGDKPVGGDHDRFHTCGVGLQQAMEVSFFLTYYIQHYYKGSSDDALFSPGQVGGYVRDTMESFELNTAKQLRHFRSKGTFFYFSGLTKDGRMCFDKTENFTLYQRFAKSTLSVVHAHVLHPSAVWMPLWQVQEMFYVLRHHRGTLLTGEDHTSQPKGGPRFHGYLVLRLYVISNILRAYGSLVSSQKVNTALEKLLSLEPAASKKKRVERAWATYLGQAMLTDYPFLAATTEGIRVAEHGLLAALSRVEQTIRTAMENELIFDVSKRQKKQKAAKAAESVAEELEPSPPDEDNDVDGETHGESAAEHSIDSERLELTLERDSTTTSYGFVVDKNTLHVTSAKPGTPFAVSVEQYAGLKGDLLTQWRITRVNRQDVHNADELIRAIRDTSSCSIELTRWQK
ncbi:hypothetical protein AGDE_08417 [Angomonas deanei]|uniref:PDZ domain-containing protein n=1 Tax=Angomonas deanei TaxID=59799 RepID=A0A7G2C8X7_9TRYP|nr:hypothetical protein AGDE_08417 [Angomonas deanei]CAD2216236.1 hypothetical protein, conserved [Angomonas deanei]|eukprot:EPY32970.1 hypothetical protein AGDE_08417 [Angomonas deanei]